MATGDDQDKLASVPSQIGHRRGLPASESLRLCVLIGKVVISGVQAKVSRNEKYDDHDSDDVENIHWLLRIESSVISI